MDKNLTSSNRRRQAVTIRDEIFDLLPERCAYRRSDQTVLASDLHWGKVETFQAHGLALPSNVIDDDLARLSKAVTETKAERLLILGDLIHAPRGVTEHVQKKVAQWRRDHENLTFQVIRGNHDKQFSWPDLWSVDDVGTELRDQNFLFTHDQPKEETGLFVWMGHIHPCVHLRGGGDSLRLPCFVIEQNLGLLPAFSAFTGGATIGKRKIHSRVFAVADESVIEV